MNAEVVGVDYQVSALSKNRTQRDSVELPSWKYVYQWNLFQLGCLIPHGNGNLVLPVRDRPQRKCREQIGFILTTSTRLKMDLPRGQGGSGTRTPPIVFVTEPSSHLKCPVCGELYIEPVINMGCGHTMCDRCLRTCGNCPVDGEQCDASRSVVNRLVVSQIDDLQIYCRYGLMPSSRGDSYIPNPNGCQDEISLGGRIEHEKVCLFSTVACPNSEHCGVFRKSGIDKHLKACIYTQCQHSIKGCQFYGKMGDVKRHSETCGYRNLVQSVSQDEFTSVTMNIEETNKILRSQIGALTSRVQALEATNSIIHSQLHGLQDSMESMVLKFDTLQASVELLFAKNRRMTGTGVNSPDRRRDSRRSLSGSPTHNARFEKWEMPFQFKCIGTFRGHNGIVWCLATHKNKLLSAGADSVIKVWDLEVLSKGCIQTVTGHSGSIHCMLVVGSCLYTAGDDHTIRVWDVNTWQGTECVSDAHDNIICAMAASKEYLFTASFSLIKIWTLNGIKLKTTISSLDHWVRTLVLSSDKAVLYSGSHNAVNIWDTTEPFSSLGKVDHEFGSIYALALTDLHIIVGTADHSVQIFDLATKKHLKELTGHMSAVQSLIASPSGRFLFSASSDSTIQIWNLENFLPIHALRRHEGSVNTIALRGDILLSGSEDREIKIFKHFQMQMGFAFNA